MDVREKLVELLSEKCMETCKQRKCYVCSVEECRRCKEKCCGFYADHLIANGVTVQEWISVNDRLPEKDGAYIAALNHHFGVQQGVSIRSFAKDGETVDEYELAGEKYVWYLYDSEYGYVSTDSVTHWMPLPKPPKGE